MQKNCSENSLCQKGSADPVIMEDSLEEKVNLLLTGVQDRFSISDIEMAAIQKLTKRLMQRHASSKTLGTQSTVSIFQYILSKIISNDGSPKSESIINDDEDLIRGLWLDDLKYNKNPIVIYKGGAPLYWNKAMENLTGYAFEEIMEKYNCGEDIMVLLYGWSDGELNKVKGALGKGESYENAVFTLQAKDGTLHQVAWFTRFKEYNGEMYSIRSGSEETSKIIEFLDQSNIAVQDFFNDIMNDKDPYTKGHINRVRTICDMIGRNMGLSNYASKQLGNMAFFHDLGKRYIDDDILKKTGAYTPEEKRIMETHTGVGIMEVLNSGYEGYAVGMVHHCDFYNKNGDPRLKFHDMIKDAKAGKNIDLADFNRLLGTNIPEEGRMISIADTIDAIGSRRIYSKRAGQPISEIIGFITKELLDSSGLIGRGGKIELNDKIWLETDSKDDFTLPYCIKINGRHYVPHPESRIQFDPLFLIRNYENGDLSNEIKLVILENDKDIVKEKVIEFIENITQLEEKKHHFSNLVSNGVSNIDQELVFSDEDETELRRLKRIYHELIHIEEEYGIIEKHPVFD